MGCTLIELRVFRALLDAGIVAYQTMPNGQRLPQFFQTTRDQLRAGGASHTTYNETEDVYFLQRAAQLGFTAAVDTSVFSFHWDQKTGPSGVGYPLEAWKTFKETGQLVLPGQAVAA